MNICYNIDCMKIMKNCTDKQYDLAIVDPIYGSENIQGGYTSGRESKKGSAKQNNYNRNIWKQEKTGPEYFIQLFRISKNQIVWGANHFVNNLFPSAGWIFWDKNNDNVKFSDGELAYSSFDVGLRRIIYTWNGMIQHNMKNKEKRIHPTQKPVDLYKWLLQNYAKPGQTIFDSHVGSGSIRIACHDLGFDFVGCELDESYYLAQEKRYQDHIAQSELFGKSEIQGLVFGGSNE